MSKKEMFLVSATRKRKKPELRKKKKLPEEKLVKKGGPRSPLEREISEKFPEAPIEIKMIATAPFIYVLYQKG